MDSDYRRISLRADLQKLIEGNVNDDTVQSCLKNMSSIFDDVDSLRLLQRHRGSSGWTDAELQRLMPSRIGNFTTSIKTRKKNRSVCFTQDGITIELIFTRNEQSTASRVDSMMKMIGQAQTEADAEAVANATLRSLVADVYSEHDATPEEILLGEAVSLANYTFLRVDRVDPGFFWKKRRTIYTAE